jgi:hypothetical protein
MNVWRNHLIKGYIDIIRQNKNILNGNKTLPFHRMVGMEEIFNVIGLGECNNLKWFLF